jgi:hypothetical protein
VFINVAGVHNEFNQWLTRGLTVGFHPIAVMEEPRSSEVNRSNTSRTSQLTKLNVASLNHRQLSN